MYLSRLRFLLISLAFNLACVVTSTTLAQNSTPVLSSNGIVINDSTGAAGSQNFADQFDGVVSLSFGGGSYCTGTLISSNAVLTARHCDAFVGDDIVFGSDLSSPDFTATVQSVVNPAGIGVGLLDGGDLAILTLDQNIPTSVATPMKLTALTTELVGMEATMVGYGWNGLGSVGHQSSSDGQRWAGQNVIDAYGSPAGAFGTNIFSTDFDDGTAINNTIAGSSPIPLALEATTAPGDSGGPLLVMINGEWVVAGVLSGGTTANSVYGDISWWTGTAPFVADIEAAGGQFVTAIPEPTGPSVIALLSLTLLGRRRRRLT